MEKKIEIIEKDTHLTKGQKRNLVRHIKILYEFLPKDTSSPWPKEIRTTKLPGLLATVCCAFDGTIGMSVQFGIMHDLLLSKLFHGWNAGLYPAQKEILYAVTNREYLDEPVKKDVKDFHKILLRYGYRFWYHIKLGDEFYDISGQDLLKMISIAKKLRNEQIRLVKVNIIQYLGGSQTLLSFVVSRGVMIHILCPTLPQQS